MQPTQTWASLRALHISGVKDGGETSQCSSTVLWLLEQAHRLQFLSLTLEKPMCLPRMAQLKHLQLTLKDSFRDLAQSLIGLTSLQTLYLEDGSLTREEHEAVNLDLTGLHELHSICLCEVVPISLSLPQSSALHLQMTRYSTLMKDVWQENASFLESAYVCEFDEACASDKPELPSFLVGSSGLKSVILDLNGCGLSRSKDLNEPFLQLERVLVHCFGVLSIRVPSGSLPWRLASFTCTGTLSVAFQNMGDFLNCCPAFFFSYQHLQGVAVPQLCQSSEERGIEYRYTSHHDENRGKVLYEVYSVSALDVLGKYVYPFSSNPVCRCGACPACSAGGSCGRDAQFAGMG